MHNRDNVYINSDTIEVVCVDGVRLVGQLWRSRRRALGSVIINGATGVHSRFYHRYAAFLSGAGFDVLTYDYRGVGGSAPGNLRGCDWRWSDWGQMDCNAAIGFMTDRSSSPLMVVGHSIGGFLPGLAAQNDRIERMLTVGGQFGWWGDYHLIQRGRLFLKWHVTMPLLTAACGYFPGRRLGWSEDLPAGVAYEWAFRRHRFELSHRPAERDTLLDRMAACRADILALVVTDDPIATPRAVERALRAYLGAERRIAEIAPSSLGVSRLGHFDLFRSHHSQSFWPDTVRWLRGGGAAWRTRPIRDLRQRSPTAAHALESLSPYGAKSTAPACQSAETAAKS